MQSVSEPLANDIIRTAVAFLAEAIENKFEPPPLNVDNIKFRALMPHGSAPFRDFTLSQCRAVLRELTGNPYTQAPNPVAKLVRVLQDTEALVEDSKTSAELLERVGERIDGTGATASALFQVEHDPRWWVVSVEGVISEANPKYVAEALADEESEDADT